MDSLLHTPEGVRDIYNEECSRKNALSAKLDRILKLYGYKDIQTPTFEFFDIFNRERGSVPSRNMYKFIDRDGSHGSDDRISHRLLRELWPSILRKRRSLFVFPTAAIHSSTIQACRAR